MNSIASILGQICTEAFEGSPSASCEDRRLVTGPIVSPFDDLLGRMRQNDKDLPVLVFTLELVEDEDGNITWVE